MWLTFLLGDAIETNDGPALQVVKRPYMLAWCIVPLLTINEAAWHFDRNTLLRRRWPE